MSQPTYFILAALLDGPRHGYAIIKRAEEMSGGTVRLAVGTLYGALDRMVGRQLIEPGEQEVVDGRARRYYRITDEGRRAAGTEAHRMAAAARLVTTRLGPGATRIGQVGSARPAATRPPKVPRTAPA